MFPLCVAIFLLMGMFMIIYGMLTNDDLNSDKGNSIIFLGVIFMIIALCSSSMIPMNKSSKQVDSAAVTVSK